MIDMGENLPTYLNRVLDEHASDQTISRAKRFFWRSYNSNLQKNRRACHKQLTLTISMELWEQLQQHADDRDLNVYGHIKKILWDATETKTTVVIDNELHLLLAEIYELLSEALEDHNLDEDRISPYIQELESILSHDY